MDVVYIRGNLNNSTTYTIADDAVFLPTSSAKIKELCQYGLEYVKFRRTPELDERTKKKLNLSLINIGKLKFRKN